MKFIFKPLLFVLFVLSLSIPIHADTMDRAIFAYDDGDYETAISIFSSLASEGDKIAKGYLVSSYIAVEDYDSLKQHLPEIEKLAQSGDANFQYILGIALSLDVDGIGNISEARQWLNSAAELGHKDAAVALGGFDIDQRIVGINNEMKAIQSEIDKLDKQIELVQAASVVLAIIIALVVNIFHSSISITASAFLREIFLAAISFSTTQTLLDAADVMPALSSITTMGAVQVIFFLVMYFIIRKYLALKID